MVRAMVIRVRALVASGARSKAQTEARGLIEMINGLDNPVAMEALRQLDSLTRRLEHRVQDP